MATNGLRFLECILITCAYNPVALALAAGYVFCFCVVKALRKFTHTHFLNPWLFPDRLGLEVTGIPSTFNVRIQLDVSPRVLWFIGIISGAALFAIPLYFGSKVFVAGYRRIV
eukprot:TRINITY_DN1263_c0_g1_i2.p1 TRINITY_DN1263_c0_g1~~TRINITY_DN1263_c0_g1_i2.p1  ORF type:complete len:113 (-),score=4.96 TRINITY_DN1263_c0_g1_i2:36-374(-)